MGIFSLAEWEAVKGEEWGGGGGQGSQTRLCALQVTEVRGQSEDFPVVEVLLCYRGWFILLAVLFLLQRRVTLLGGWFTLLAVLFFLQRRVTLLGISYSASSSGPPAA